MPHAPLRAHRAPHPRAFALALLLAASAVLPGCGADDKRSKNDAKDAAISADSAATSNDAASSDSASAARPALPEDLTAVWYPAAVSATDKVTWKPGTHLALGKDVRHGKLRDVRGLIHAHSVYSHDACDGKPLDKDGKINKPCLKDFRDDLCKVKHDFVMLTDHPDTFRDHEFPEVLLFDADRGDKLQKRGEIYIANQLSCVDAHGQRTTLLLAGCEGDSMPVGLEGHAGATIAERQKAYRGKASVDSFDRLHKAGALVLAQHTEDWSVKQLSELPFDGFEMYNVHNNMLLKVKLIGKLIGVLLDPKQAPAPDLLFAPLLWENPIYQERWGSVLALGKRRVGTMGTDCHQNVFNLALADGERVDRYRRLMSWFSNHLLVEVDAQGGFDDRALKTALKKGRLYGVFEVFGYAQGFDFHGRVGGTTTEIGDRVEMGASPSLAKGVELVVRRPTVAGRDPKTPAPELTLRILRAKEGGFDLVAEAKSGDLRWTVDQPGAYRAEVRMVPKHLQPWTGALKDIATDEVIWIYANPIYIKK